MTRILITGSRAWTDREAIATHLLAHANAEGVTVLVHGACPTGADAMADSLARYRFGWCVEAYPADWDKHGKAAGPLRNQEMVDLGADVCLAFPQGESRGTRDCMRRAEAAGIPVHNHGDDK